MTDIVATAAKIAPVNPMKAKIKDFMAGATLTAGQPVYIAATGKIHPADANGSSPVNRFRGIALKSGAVGGQAVPVLMEGEIAGFEISGLAYDAEVFVSDTAGSLADAAGSTSLSVGRVVPLTDKDRTKVLLVTGISG